MKNKKMYIGEIPTFTYVFFRVDCFYPIELESDEDAIDSAEINEGTLRVEDLNGRIIWQLNK